MEPSKGSTVGRLTETTPADISMAVQPTVGPNVYVGSELSYKSRTLVRYAEAKTTLTCEVSKSDMKGALWGLVQESKAESTIKTNLGCLLQLKFPYLVDRKQQNDHVCDEGGCCIGDPRSDLIDAISLEMRTPEFLHRNAGKDKDEGYT